MALQLEEDKALILRLVQQKMDRIAPNLSAAVRPLAWLHVPSLRCYCLEASVHWPAVGAARSVAKPGCGPCTCTGASSLHAASY